MFSSLLKMKVIFRISAMLLVLLSYDTALTKNIDGIGNNLLIEEKFIFPSEQNLKPDDLDTTKVTITILPFALYSEIFKYAIVGFIGTEGLTKGTSIKLIKLYLH